jgi:hypothetical protein
MMPVARAPEAATIILLPGTSPEIAAAGLSAVVVDLRLRLKDEFPTLEAMHAYEVRPRKDHRGVDLISGALPFGGLWYGGPNAVANTIGYAQF